MHQEVVCVSQELMGSVLEKHIGFTMERLNALVIIA